MTSAVDQRCLDGAGALHVEPIPGAARRQQAAGDGAARLQEGQPDRCASPGDAVEHGIALHRRAAVRDREARLDPLVQVAVVEGEHRLAVRRPDDPFVHGEGTHGCREVAAVAAVIDQRPVDRDLAEEIVDVHAGARARAHNHRLAEGREAAAHAVELAPVRVGAAEGGEEERVPTPPAPPAGRGGG